jgi:signal peptidase II
VIEEAGVHHEPEERPAGDGTPSASDRHAPDASDGKQGLVLGVMGSLLALDLLSKAWIQGNFLLGQSMELIGDWVRLTYLLNPGAAFGLHVGGWSRAVFATLAVLAVAVVVVIVRETPAADRLRLAALSLILGGALGNLLDRLRAHGAVVDFLDVGFGSFRWPVFNVADVGVTTGAVLLVVLLWGERPSEAAERGTETAAESDASPAPGG